MTKRQKAIFDLLDSVRVTADVGCDHGILSLEMLKSGRTERVVASDISAPSLHKTVELLANNGLSAQADFVCCDGVPSGHALDQILIAGMGGYEITGILERYFAATKDRPVLVLQPMRDFERVRRTISGLGYQIVADKMIFDKKFYLLLKCVPGAQTYTREQYVFGVDAANYREPDYQRWLDAQIAKTEAILSKITANDPKYENLTRFLDNCKTIKRKYR